MAEALGSHDRMVPSVGWQSRIGDTVQDPNRRDRQVADEDLVLEPRDDLPAPPDPGQYRKVAKKNTARTVWRWVTIIMGVIVGYNVLNAVGLQEPDARTELCADLSEFGCDLAIGAATAINVTFAIGAGVLGLIALAVWLTRDKYKEVVEPIEGRVI